MRRFFPTAIASHPHPLRRAIGSFSGIVFGGTALLLCSGNLAAAPAGNLLGLPFTRAYSYEEIGNAVRGARLGFDDLGRVAVMSSGSYSVLNDTTWMDLTDRESDGPALQSIVYDRDGQAYYGSFGAWGPVQVNAHGLLRAKAPPSSDFPKWVLSANFSEIIPTASGIYFGGVSGVVYRERATGRQQFFEIPESTHTFAVGDQVYVATHGQGILRIDLEQGTLQPASNLGHDDTWVDQVAAFDSGRVLLTDSRGHLMLFDGHTLAPWPGILGERAVGRATALSNLPEGGAAIAIAGHGLYLTSATGEILAAYTTQEYQRITDLAAREPGVLWVATESGIEKLLYRNPLTVFGQKAGLPVSWAQVVQWRNRIVVASAGRLYETTPDDASPPGTLPETQLFHPVPGQPSTEVWAIAAQGDQLLVGAAATVLAREPDGALTPVLENFNPARLVMVSDELCYVIGVKEITVLRRRGSRWEECAPRVPGLGYPSVVHSAGQSAWVELGADRAARITLADGRIQVRLFEHFPWRTPRWVNIGAVGDTVVMIGEPDHHLFFDEKSGAFVEAPALKKLFAESPQPLRRLQQDRNGIVWGVHDHGLLRFDRQGDGYQASPAYYGKIKERFPNIHLLPDGDVWLSAAQSLYHVNRGLALGPPAPVTPRVVSVVASRTNRDLLGGRHGNTTLPPLAYAENSLTLKFFTGGYTLRQPPEYDFHLHRGGQSWPVAGNGSLLTLADLREGTYRLEVRVMEVRAPAGPPLFLEFTIAPPWYRTWTAYTLYVSTSIALVFGLIRWFNQRARARYLALEKIVDVRTEQLRAAMHQLNLETRHAATVAERDRLAGEIHDSLQQGLSGLMLHLDATLKLPKLSEDVRARLGLARNMVSFTRHEVQHAVWDMETPLLEGTELGDALRKITRLIGPGETQVEITVNGLPCDLSPSTKHHLLRIAQEAITNAVRHSAARTIVITLDYEAGAVTLSVTDDGNGFVPHDVLNKGLGHFGLRGLRGRAAKIGGDLKIDSAPGRGTTVRVRVQLLNQPLAHADRA